MRTLRYWAERDGKFEKKKKTFQNVKMRMLIAV